MYIYSKMRFLCPFKVFGKRVMLMVKFVTDCQIYWPGKVEINSRNFPLTTDLNNYVL